MSDGYRIKVTWQPRLAFVNGKLVEYVYKDQGDSLKIEMEPLTKAKQPGDHTP